MSTVVMSIKPKFAEAILSGRKHCEFRRLPFSKPVSQIVIYATAPIQLVLGIVSVEAVVHDDLPKIKDKYLSQGYVSDYEFDSYFAGKTQGVAILLGTRARLFEPVKIKTIWSDVYPPQSYSYLDSSKVVALDKFMELQPDSLRGS